MKMGRHQTPADYRNANSLVGQADQLHECNVVVFIPEDLASAVAAVQDVAEHATRIGSRRPRHAGIVPQWQPKYKGKKRGQATFLFDTTQKSSLSPFFVPFFQSDSSTSWVDVRRVDVAADGDDVREFRAGREEATIRAQGG